MIKRRDAVDGRFFEEAYTEASLTTPRHPDADGVSDQVFGVVEQPTRLSLFRGQIVWPA